DAAGNDGDLYAGRRAGQPADGPHVRLRRPAGEAQMSAAGPHTHEADATAPTPLAYFASQTLKAFNTNKTSWIGLAVFLIVVIVAILAPVLAPYYTHDQN